MTLTHTAVTFDVVDIAPERHALEPQLTARVAVAAHGPEPVHAIALRAQVRIEPVRRGYAEGEADGLLDLFGPRRRWPQTLRTMLWQHTSVMVPGFTGSTEVTLPLMCTYDFEVASAKYLHALREHAVPLLFLFSGTIFTRGERGFSVQQVSWDSDDRYDMPVQVWRDLMAAHYPDRGWVRLGHETITALARYKSARGLLDLDMAVCALLDDAREEVP